MDLTRICARLKNHFLRDKHEGTFTIVSGTAPLSLLEGQYFVIVGSLLNEGVFQNTAASLATLKNETFKGRIWSMAVPRDFETLAADADAFSAKVAELGAADKGYTSESFGGYSYSLSSSAPAYMQAWARRLDSGFALYQKIREDL